MRSRGNKTYSIRVSDLAGKKLDEIARAYGYKRGRVKAIRLLLAEIGYPYYKKGSK